MAQPITTVEGFSAAVAIHTQKVKRGEIIVKGTKDGQPVTTFNGRTGEWARQLHLAAGGCDKTAGHARLVL